MKTSLSLIGMLVIAASAIGADHDVEKLEQGPPEGLAEAVASQLNATGVKVVRGTRTVCEIWLSKQWELKTWKPVGDVNFPFTPGQLIGAVRYPRRAGDFRDQQIASGVYTLRYAQQPVDGAHVGTSPTRDYLLLVKAEQDQSAALIDYEQLAEASTEAAGTAHPALLSMQKTRGEAQAPSIRNDQEHDWWIVRLSSKAAAEGKTQPLTFDLVVVGAAAE